LFPWGGLHLSTPQSNLGAKSVAGSCPKRSEKVLLGRKDRNADLSLVLVKFCKRVGKKGHSRPEGGPARIPYR